MSINSDIDRWKRALSGLKFVWATGWRVHNEQKPHEYMSTLSIIVKCNLRGLK